MKLNTKQLISILVTGIILSGGFLFAQNDDIQYSSLTLSELNEAFLVASNRDGSIELVKKIILAGADVNTRNKYGETPLTISLMDDNRELAAYLIDVGAHVNTRSDRGITPLRIAVHGRNNGVMIKLLLDSGADANVPDKEGTTPLMIALQRENNLEVVNLLLNGGADVMATDKRGRKAEDYLSYFEFKKIRELIKLLTRRGEIAISQNIDDFTDFFQDDPTIETASAFLEAGGDPNAPDSKGTSPFAAACIYGPDPEIISLFIQHGADVNQKIDDRWTPITLMSYNNIPEEETYRALIDAGADLNSQDMYGYTPLMQNISFDVMDWLYNQLNSSKITEDQFNNMIGEKEEQKLKNISFLIQNGADVNIKSSRGDPVLTIAIFSGMTNEVIDTLLNAGAHINAADNEGMTALLVAAKIKDSELLEFLLDAGADALIENEKGKTICDYIQNYQLSFDPELFSRIESLFSEKALFPEEVTSRELFGIMEYVSINPQTVLNYIKSGGDVNVTNNNGDSLLILAAITAEDPLVFDLLIKAGADVNAMDKNNSTALFLAAANRVKGEILELLLEAGADVNNRNMGGLTPLFAAIYNQSENIEFLQILINGGADIHAENNEGATPLILALSQSRNPEIIRLLLDGQTVNHSEKNGWTPLMVAAGNTHSDMSLIIPLLLTAGADIYDYNKDAWTALRIAAEFQKDPMIVSLLVDAGGNIHSTDIAGKSALDYMRENETLKNSDLYHQLKSNTH